MAVVLKAKERTNISGSELRRLRREGRLPAVVYGKDAENIPIHLSKTEFQKWFREGASGMVELQIEGKQKVVALLEDIQRDPVTRELIHADFQSVRSDTPIRTKIPVKFNGTPEAARQGGVVLVQNATIEVEALPKDLPEELEYDISGLQMGGVVQVKDIPVPSGVTVISDPEETLLSVSK